jgi:insertion element IS1 protein InsB
MILRMLVNGNGVRDICRIALVSAGCVLRTLLSIGNLITIEPQRKHYSKVQIDELYSFVGSKKKKVWIIYAYDAFTGEILGLRLEKEVKSKSEI